MKVLFSIIKFAFTSVFILGLLNSSECSVTQLTDSTQVMVVATIHGNHDNNTNYTYQDLLNIISAFQPDAICVEIPESYFRKNSYLKEMMLATIYGITHSLKVYPIDWWTPGDDRSKYNEYVKTEEYKIKEKQYNELEAADSIMQKFYAKYESYDKVWDSNQKGYDFFNGSEYNNYICAMYAINLKVFGDGPMNLHYLTRNNNMLALIDKVITDNIGKKVIVLTGAEHKHYFDMKLSQRTDLKLVNFNSILPLKSEKPNKDEAEFIENNLTRSYYNVLNSQVFDMMYHGALISLLHGEGMDDEPDIIPKENIQKSISIMQQWKRDNPKSAFFLFESAWIEFLQGNFKKSIQTLKAIDHKLDEIPEDNQWFVKSFYFRNLGFCYDMLGKRGKAVKSYNAGIEMCKKLGAKEPYIKAIYKNYIEIPFNGEKR